MPTYYEFDIALEEVEPRIWRRLQLPADATFLDLHDAIQDACGWQNYHLFAFRDEYGESIAGIPDDEWGEPDPDAAKVLVADFFESERRCLYEYDFGDSWVHEVELRRIVESSERFERRLLDGARAFPSEDCGGVQGYEECVEVARGGEDPEGLRDWLGDWDPERFDLDQVRQAFDRPRQPSANS
ncbi:MAG: plasmid pRiA4b ORF-3 family protein [Egibacteraceae bacterium]